VRKIESLSHRVIESFGDHVQKRAFLCALTRFSRRSLRLKAFSGRDSQRTQTQTCTGRFQCFNDSLIQSIP
jgi:hypothetical protein